MAMMQKVIVELSDADRRLLKRVAAAVENLSPQVVESDPSRQVRLEESAAAQEDDSVFFPTDPVFFPTVGLDGVVRHV